MRKTYERFGAIDVLMNNAGHGYRAAIEESAPEAVEEIFQTGFFGPMELIRLSLPQMRGNVCFNFSIPIQEPDVLYLTDIWEDEASFQAHLESQETAAWSALKETYVENSHVRRYDL